MNLPTSMAETINPAIQAFPELAPTDDLWRAVARDRALRLLQPGVSK